MEQMWDAGKVGRNTAGNEWWWDQGEVGTGNRFEWSWGEWCRGRIEQTWDTAEASRQSDSLTCGAWLLVTRHRRCSSVTAQTD